MAEETFYCPACTSYKPLSQKGHNIHGKLPRCTSCIDKAKRRTGELRKVKALFDKKTPIE